MEENPEKEETKSGRMDDRESCMQELERGRSRRHVANLGARRGRRASVGSEGGWRRRTARHSG